MSKYSETLYPLTVISDRYNGTYSGGKFTAWSLEYFEIPDGPQDGDNACQSFWCDYDGIVGLGETAQEAINDLVVKMNNIDSMPKEPKGNFPDIPFGSQKDLEEEINNWLDDGLPNEGELVEHIKETARHFANWQKQKDSLPVGDDLEDAAEKYAQEAYSHPVDRNVGKADFILGAQWQKQQTLEALRTEYEKGRYDMREQMTKEAKIGVCDNDNFILFNDGKAIDLDPSMQLKPAFDIKEGDKVKLIIVKED